MVATDKVPSTSTKFYACDVGYTSIDATDMRVVVDFSYATQRNISVTTAIEINVPHERFLTLAVTCTLTAVRINLRALAIADRSVYYITEVHSVMLQWWWLSRLRCASVLCQIQHRP